MNPRVLLALAACVPAAAAADRGYWVCVSNERSGDVTVIDGADGKAVATVPVGKRPRGVHPSPDGRTLYVAVSGSPITGPPKLDPKGKPIFEEPREDADPTADGIAVVDPATRKFVKKLPAGADPEEFAVSPDGRRLYIANEDVGTLSVANVIDGRVERIVRVKKEPEGVRITPDGKYVYVTCETGGEVFVIDTATNKAVAEFTVGGRPRTIAFLPDGSRAFVPSETDGVVHVIDTAAHKPVRAIRLPDGSRPMGTAMASDGRRLYVSAGAAETGWRRDPAHETVLGTIPVGKRPWVLGISPDGKWLYVAN